MMDGGGEAGGVRGETGGVSATLGPHNTDWRSERSQQTVSQLVWDCGLRRDVVRQLAVRTRSGTVRNYNTYNRERNSLLITNVAISNHIRETPCFILTTNLKAK